jgi:sensor histidine kinase YesM
MIAANEGTQVFMQRSGSTLLVVLLFFPFYFLMLSLMFRFTFKRSANVITATQRFEFTGDSLRVECAGQVMTGSTETGYENFYRAYETKSDLYLYINKIQAFMLPKRDLAGNEEKLIALLKGKMGKNYIKCF